jgi:hypothetical protein
LNPLASEKINAMILLGVVGGGKDNMESIINYNIFFGRKLIMETKLETTVVFHLIFLKSI